MHDLSRQPNDGVRFSEAPGESGFAPDIARKLAAGIESGLLRHLHAVIVSRADQMVLDVGPKSVAVINEWIDKAATLVWNGPLGAFEVKPFDKATVAAARAAAERTKAGKLLSVAGGGETVSALHHAGAADGVARRRDRPADGQRARAQHREARRGEEGGGDLTPPLAARGLAASSHLESSTFSTCAVMSGIRRTL